MAVLVQREVRAPTDSADVRELVASARLKKAHATARYEIRLLGAPAGTLGSVVSGGQKEEQLAYVVTGVLERPQRVDLRGFALAGWDRRLERFVLEATTGGDRFRIEGSRATVEPRVFTVRHGGAVDAAAGAWVLPEAPLLAPGPLPVPELFAAAPAGRAGTIVDPVTGQPAAWRLEEPREEVIDVAGRPRRAMRLTLAYGALAGTLWAEPTGFPLRLDVPPALSLVLVEETR
jgi:hypothetical protein